MDRCEYASPQNMLATLNYNMSLYMHTSVEDTCYIISWMLLHKPTTVEYLCYILLRMSLNMQTNVVHACNIILGMSWYRHSTVVCCCCILYMISFMYVCVCLCVSVLKRYVSTSLHRLPPNFMHAIKICRGRFLSQCRSARLIGRALLEGLLFVATMAS